MRLMLGETGFGIWVAYGLIVLFLVLVVLILARMALMLSLLWLAPAAVVVRRVLRLRPTLPTVAVARSEEPRAGDRLPSSSRGSA